MLSQEVLFFGGFTIIVLGILFFDLMVVGRNTHVISFKESIIWTSVWVSLALLFYLVIVNYGDRLHGITNMEQLLAIKAKYASHLTLDMSSFENSLEIYRNNMGLEYISGYLIEYTLSMDNVFVIMMILASFSVREEYYKEVLFWGILGAIVLRFIFIFAGAALIQRFEWILLVFGAFLIYTGIKIFLTRNEEEKVETQNHPIVKFLSRYANVYPKFVDGHFFIRTKKKVFLTPLFIVLIIIEFTDVIFAMDSIPAIFSITRDPFLVFFSNIFAIMGLRSLFFLLMRVVNIFHYLKIGISFLLTFVGVKLLFHTWLEHLGFKPVYSLYIILGTLVVCILASILFPQKEKPSLPFD
jgi:tellurite resistance protein TerC